MRLMWSSSPFAPVPPEGDGFCSLANCWNAVEGDEKRQSDEEDKKKEHNRAEYRSYQTHAPVGDGGVVHDAPPFWAAYHLGAGATI